jgi:hypothetical protein
MISILLGIILLSIVLVNSIDSRETQFRVYRQSESLLLMICTFIYVFIELSSFHLRPSLCYFSKLVLCESNSIFMETVVRIELAGSEILEVYSEYLSLLEEVTWWEFIKSFYPYTSLI